MPEIRFITDSTNNIVLPATHERAVLDSNGVNLETKLEQKQETLVSGTNIKTINNESLLGQGNLTLITDTSNCEKLENKTTSISSSSTDAQYPSAKSVYSFFDSAMQNVISFPAIGIDEDMHLKIESVDESSLSLFSIDSSGHLIMTVN